MQLKGSQSDRSDDGGAAGLNEGRMGPCAGHGLIRLWAADCLRDSRQGEKYHYCIRIGVNWVHSTIIKPFLHEDNF